MEDRLERLLQAVVELKQKIEECNQRISALEKKEIVKPWQPYQPPFKKEIPTPKPYKKPEPINWKALELKLGKYGLQIIGMVIFLLGMGFLLKYAIDQEWISPTVRVVLGLLTATGLIAAAEVLSGKLKQWTAPLMGGGLVVYYLSFYAAYQYYDIISAQNAFLAFIATTVLAGILAVRHNDLIIGIFSLLGGYATPLILHSLQQTDPGFLTTYLLSLALGFIVLGYVKRWHILSGLSLVCMILYPVELTFFPGQLYGRLLFMLSMYAIYTVIPYICALIMKPKQSIAEPVLIAVNTLYLFVLGKGELIFYHTRYPEQLDKALWIFASWIKAASNADIIKYLCFLFGGAMLAKLICLFVRDKKNTYLLATLFCMTVGFFAGVIVIQWQYYALSIALHVFALSLFLLGMYLQQAFIRAFAYLFWLISCYNLVITYFRYRRIELESIIWNSINLATGIIVLIFALSAWLTYRFKNNLTKNEEQSTNILMGGSIMTIAYWMHTPVWIYPYHILGLVWYAFSLLYAGLYYRMILFRQFAYGIGATAAVYFLFNHDYLLRPKYLYEINYLFASFAAMCAGTIWLATQWKARLSAQEKQYLQPTAELLTSFFVFTWIRANIIAYFSESPKIYRQHTQKIDALTTIYYGLYSLAIIVIGLCAKKPLLRYFGLVLVALTLWKLWFIIMAMQTLYRIIAFLIIGIVFTLASLLYQRMSKQLK